MRAGTRNRISSRYSLGEADVGADGVFVPPLSRVVAGGIALVTRAVLYQSERAPVRTGGDVNFCRNFVREHVCKSTTFRARSCRAGAR